MRRSILTKRFFSSVIPLHDRVVLKVSGADTKKFLQGLCTNDLNLLKNKGDNLVASFLNSKGRIFVNTFIYAENENDVLLETHSALAADLKRHLTLYKLRSKISITNTDYQVLFSPNNSLSESDNHVIVKVTDPRVTDLGFRIIKTGEKLPVDKNISEWITTFDLLHGLAEGPEISNKIPLECNLDLLRYISFAKGCYIGQELTARTRYKGLVRKRLVPFLLSDSLENNVTNNPNAFDTLQPSFIEKILSETKEGNVYGATFASPKVEKGDKVYKTLQQNPVGEIVHTNSIGTLGLAMINLDAIHSHAGNFTVRQAPSEDGESEGEGKTHAQSDTHPTNVPTKFISTFRPSWFHGLDEKTNLKLNE